jgi:hypothetical protein
VIVGKLVGVYVITFELTHDNARPGGQELDIGKVSERASIRAKPGKNDISVHRRERSGAAVHAVGETGLAMELEKTSGPESGFTGVEFQIVVRRTAVSASALLARIGHMLKNMHGVNFELKAFVR